MRVAQGTGEGGHLIHDRGIVTETCSSMPTAGSRLSKSWENACKNAGLGEEINTGTKTKSGKHVTKIKPLCLRHDFSRSAVRNLVRSGVPDKWPLQMSAYKTRLVFERYTTPSTSMPGTGIEPVRPLRGSGF